MKLADTLIDALGEADLSAYHDEYAQAVEMLVTAKLEGAEPPAVGEEARGGNVVDLMAALRASVEQASGGDRSGGAKKKSTPKKTAGRKSPAKKPEKTAAKKTAAKKTASRRRAS
jgi:DNA end-binding protein Ku